MVSAAQQAQQAMDVRLVIEAIPILARSFRPDGSAEYFNRCWLNYAGL